MSFASEPTRNKYVAKTDSTAKKVNKEKSSFKKVKKAELLKKIYDQTNWNSLFLNPNTILQKMAEKFGLQKKDILGKDVEDGAVRLALCETEVLQETKAYLESQAVQVTVFDKQMSECLRSSTTLMVKNIPQGCSK